MNKCKICSHIPKIKKTWFTQEQKFIYSIECCYISINSDYRFYNIKELINYWNRIMSK